MIDWLELEPVAAVAAALAAAPGSEPPMALDLYLRSRLVDYLQNRRGQRRELETALHKAVDAARRRGWSRQQICWTYFFELLETGARLTSRAESLQAITGRAREVLTTLTAAREAPLQHKELAQRVGITESHLGNLLSGLCAAGLVVRQKLPGTKAVWLVITFEGLELIEKLNVKEVVKPKGVTEPLPPKAVAHEIELWPNQARTAA
jgi:DNA-binding MarR family transcriptional regulator